MKILCNSTNQSGQYWDCTDLNRSRRSFAKYRVLHERNMNSPQPFLFGNTNDAYAYILTKEDFNSFERYNYVSRTSLGEMTGEIYIKEALKMIKESPMPDKQLTE